MTNKNDPVRTIVCVRRSADTSMSHRGAALISHNFNVADPPE